MWDTGVYWWRWLTYSVPLVPLALLTLPVGRWKTARCGYWRLPFPVAPHVHSDQHYAPAPVVSGPGVRAGSGWQHGRLGRELPRGVAQVAGVGQVVVVHQYPMHRPARRWGHVPRQTDGPLL